MFGLVEDADEIILGQIGQLNADGESALQFGHQIARLAAVERAGGDEEDVIGFDRAVLGDDGGAFDDRQEIALDALAGDIGAVLGFGAADFVDFVEEDDAALLDALDGVAIDFVAIDQFFGFLGEEDFARIAARPVGGFRGGWAASFPAWIGIRRPSPCRRGRRRRRVVRCSI